MHMFSLVNLNSRIFNKQIPVSIKQGEPALQTRTQLFIYISRTKDTLLRMKMYIFLLENTDGFVR